MKIHPRPMQNHVVTQLITPTQLVSTFDPSLPMTCTKVKDRVKGIICISTGNFDMKHKSPQCYTIDIKFWTVDNDRHPSYSIGVCLPRSWSPQLFLAAVQQTVSLGQDIRITEVWNPMKPFDWIVTVNNIAQLYFKLPKSNNLCLQLSDELCAVDGGMCIHKSS